MTIEHSIHVRAGYDHRDEPHDNGGAHGAEMVLVAKGPLGAIEAIINTGWMHRPLVGRYVRGGGVQPRRDEPGLDAGVWDKYPRASYVLSHAATPIRDWLRRYEVCTYIEGGCYSDIGYTIADSVLEALVTGGSDAAFARLDEIYTEWLTPEPVEASGS